MDSTTKETLRPRTTLPPTPITLVDTEEAVHKLCEHWRAQSMEGKHQVEKNNATFDKKQQGHEALESGEKDLNPVHKRVRKADFGCDVQSTHSSVSDSVYSTLSGGRLLLGLDLEGRSLGHSGTLDILAIYDVAANITYLFDIVVLQQKAFLAGPNGQWSLKELIEIGGGRHGEGQKNADCGNILFLVYDVRMDAAALAHLYGVKLGGHPTAASTRSVASPAPTCGCVYDLQVPFTIGAGGRFLHGLQKVLVGISYLTKEDDGATTLGKCIFDPTRGGSYEKWAERPLSDDLIKYCAVTIRYYGEMFKLINAVSDFRPRLPNLNPLNKNYNSIKKCVKPIVDADMVFRVTECRLRPQVDTKAVKQGDSLRDF